MHMSLFIPTREKQLDQRRSSPKNKNSVITSMRMEGWVHKIFQQLHNKTAVHNLELITPLLWMNSSFKCLHIILIITRIEVKMQLIIPP